MMHELIHAFDFCRIDMNPQSCLHMACTEIRAANLSGDCNLSLEVIRGHGLSFTGHKQTCVKRIATTSLMMNPGCREHAERSVELAWANCWPDLQPYDHIP
jgi:inner membrane protease ATP23